MIAFFFCVLTHLCFDSDDENEDDRSGDRVDDNEDNEDNEDAMSIASQASAQMNILTATMQNNMVQMQAMMNLHHQTTTTLQTNLAAMLTAVPPQRARASRTPAIVDGVITDSPRKIAFLVGHDKVLFTTDIITKQIQEMNIYELWWVQQWVDESKIKYDMNSKGLKAYKKGVWDFHAKQTAGMTVDSTRPART